MGKYKQLNSGDYQLILALADHGMKYMVAANNIGMHHGSAHGRLEKIYRLTGLDPRNFYDLQKLVEMVKGGDTNG